MDTESFELKILDIVEETGDARSISFEVPEGQEEHFTYKPGQFLALAVRATRPASLRAATRSRAARATVGR